MGHLEPNPTARLGLALARLAEVMPLVPTGDTRDYLFLLQDLARQTLERVADGRGPLE
jgi:hypothetical protein